MGKDFKLLKSWPWTKTGALGWVQKLSKKYKGKHLATNCEITMQATSGSVDSKL